MSTSETILKLESVKAQYGNIKALNGISLEVKKGEIISLLGANGAGKSTTLLTISGIVPVASGSITFKGEEITTLESNKIVERGLLQVPEGRRIFPSLSVKDNLEMGAFLQKDKKKIEEGLDYVYDLFPRLKERHQQQGGTLSGGEQQMLAISRALMGNPELLLLDEPSLGLAPIIVAQIFEILQRINKERGTTIFLVEQNANMALKISQRAYVLETGNITIEDTAENVAKNPHVREAYLGG